MTDTPDSQPSHPTTAPRSAMFIVFLVVFIDLLGFGIVLPLLPRYTDYYMHELDVARWVKGAIIGGILSSFSAMQFLFAPIWGRISDRIGRKPVLLIGLAGSVLFYLLFGLASELKPEEGSLALLLIFLTRIGAGIAGATISTAQAVIADCTPPDKRAHGMALIGAAFGIGFTFGPLIAYAGVTLMSDEHGAPGYFAAGVSLIALLLATWLFKETRQPGLSAPKRSWLDVRGLVEVLRMPTIGFLVFTFFLATFAFANFEGTLSMLTKSAFRMGEEDNYLIFAYIGFVLMFAQGFIYRKLAKKYHEIIMMQLGIFLMLLGMGGLGIVAYFTSSAYAAKLDARIYLPIFYITLAITVFGFAFLNPSVSSLISKRSDPNRQGEVLGTNQAFSALARILGPIVGMVLFELEGTHILPYLLAGGMMGMVFLLAGKVQRMTGPSSPEPSVPLAH